MTFSYLRVLCPHPTGLCPGDEILVLNGQAVSSLDLALIQTLFAEQTLQLILRRDGPLASPLLSDPPTPLANQSHLLQDLLDTHHRAKSTTGETAFMETHTHSLPRSSVFLEVCEGVTFSQKLTNNCVGCACRVCTQDRHLPQFISITVSLEIVFW